MTTYTDLIAGMTATATGHGAHVTDDWKQGRTTYGGLSAALCLEAALRTLPDAPPLRSGQFAFIGPAAGELAIETKVLRQGKSTLFVGVDLVGEQGLATRAILTFGAARESLVAHSDLPCPVVAPPADCEFFFPPGSGPGFSGQFEVRMAGGTRPLSGQPPEYLLWIRHRDPTARSLAALIALADTPPPPAMALFPKFGPISTMTWSLDVVGLPAEDDDGWRLLRSTAETIGDGYSTQDMMLWDQGGRPLIAARQNVAVFV
ncbi:thioesterase family protein [Caulobacter henricii]|uniref:Acyl-CoA thioesterase n=1 Tax=Caulobacter henricii TaxID=69395 RepID=A0A0P0P0P3_9CAUL|nr:thioesterase family protein [Caulobacter henricii]ALL14020.1 acyl-CoA thioesterase [Caulobacter henricii]